LIARSIRWLTIRRLRGLRTTWEATRKRTLGPALSIWWRTMGRLFYRIRSVLVTSMRATVTLPII
jgi:hypothetical protein